MLSSRDVDEGAKRDASTLASTPTNVADAERPYLLVITGERAWSFALPEGDILIGRGDGVHMMLEEERVSRRHAHVTCNADARHRANALRSFAQH